MREDIALRSLELYVDLIVRVLPSRGSFDEMAGSRGVSLDSLPSTPYEAMEILAELRAEYMSRRRREPAIFHARHLQRYQLGTSYPSIVADGDKILRRDPLRDHNRTLAIDGTGVGAAVVDMFVGAKLTAELCPILITGGDSAFDPTCHPDAHSAVFFSHSSFVRQ